MNVKRLIPLALVLALLAGGGTAAVFALNGGDDDPSSAESILPGDCSLVHNVDACDQDAAGDTGSLGMCVEGVPDCNDMVVEPAGAGTEPCAVTLEAECDTVDGSPPIRSDEGIDPDECSLVHNIDACSPEDIARRNGAATAFDITIPFNTSVTEEDTKIVSETVLAFDPNADVLLLESFPPTGHATAASADPGFCAAVEAELEAIPAVGDVTCAVAPASPENPPGPDEPVSSEPGSSPGIGPAQE